MHSDDRAPAFRDIIDDALGSLRAAQRATTNLYLDTMPYLKGSSIGPRFQRIRARQRCIVVFADDDPMANFAHPCRYRLYDAETHAFLYEVAARFPPHLHFVPKTFSLFHESVRARRRSTLRTPLEIEPAPAVAPVARERYAILFCGSSDRRHLNDLEYCYRMLTERYLFKPANICVLCFDNTRTIADGSPATNWPEESGPPDPYRIPVPPASSLPSFKADRAGFQLACQHIAPNLQPQDLVFVHTGGHGDAFLVSGRLQDPWLVAHDEQPYFAADFCDDLATLPPHESLLLVMQQCYSGQFVAPIVSAQGPAVNQIKAQRLSLACASADPSYSNEDATFDKFMLGWVTAHLAKDPFGLPPVSVVDTGGGAGGSANGLIEAREAYAYAASVAHPKDTPVSENVPAVASVAMGAATLAAGDIRLTAAM